MTTVNPLGPWRIARLEAAPGRHNPNMLYGLHMDREEQLTTYTVSIVVEGRDDHWKP
jgi:hypothetical protein